ncbi:MAG: chemotaxis-specific protein-glutamate methyltransferase CheB [Planctomycetia bacterium]|nr:chemotaxis-specific protein-glutamate methyltransferase CheB [Planctomycetia bacterium]
MNEPITVLVVDDSPFVCRLLTAHLQSAPGLQVVGTAHDGAQALERTRQLRPQVVTLDVDMPGTDGLQVLEAIMQRTPTPVLLVSGVGRRAASATMQALERGAVDFIPKFTPGATTNPQLWRQDFIDKVRLAARIKVVRSLPQPLHRPTAAGAPRPRRDPGGVVVVGASTGGPSALRELLGGLSADFASAVIVVQHMPASFTRVLAEQLDRQLPLAVKEAEHGERVLPRRVLVAPGGYHLLIGPNGHVELVQGPKIGGHCPSIDATMQSAAEVYGARSRGVVLTGMGSDGALGLAAIRARGGETFAQSAATCVVNGMPQQAVDRGVVDWVAAPGEIARLLERCGRMASVVDRRPET